MITQKVLKSVLKYDPETGIWTWLVKASQKQKGDLAGSLERKGYWVIHYNHVCYKAHRLAFVYMLGRWPANDVDHIDRDPLNNRWKNLREATRSQNRFNSKVRADSKSGVTGVLWQKRMKKWQASIQVNGKRTYLGSFDTIAEAIEVRNQKAKEYFSEFNPNLTGIGNDK